MRKIEKKNYIILIALILFTILITLFLSKVYIKKNDTTSNLYDYSNKITSNEFEQYIIENSHSIIYIADKYDLSNKKFETKLSNVLNQNNLKEIFVFMDKSEIDKEFLTKLNKLYKINMDLDKLPVILFVIDNKISKTTYIDYNSDINSIIEYEEFE